MPITINGSGTVTGISAGGLPSGSVTSDTLASSAVYLTAPAGAVCFVAQNTAPTGWLKANGAAVSRTTYADLFAALGTTFGAGNGSTTFNLPDLRGEFPRCWDDGRGIDSGRLLGSAQAQDYQSHNHGVTDPGHVHYFNYQVPLNTGDTDRGSESSLFSVDNSVIPNTASNTTGISIQNSGATETRPRNIALLAIIKF